MTTETNTNVRQLADFEGRWTLARQIRHDDGTRAEFTGEAVWQPAPFGLIYHETGTLRLPGRTEMRAERRYLWHETLDVHFEDGRFFHQVPARGGMARHWCAPDRYQVTYDFSKWPVFQVDWQVTGPRKSYEMASHYRRATRMGA